MWLFKLIIHVCLSGMWLLGAVSLCTLASPLLSNVNFGSVKARDHVMNHGCIL